MIRVKICGVTGREDALLCASVGADAIGNIVEIKSSPRSVSVEKSQEIFSALPVFVSSVIVIANKDIDFVLNAVSKISPSALQLHGNEDLDFVKSLKRAFGKNKIGTKTIKTIHVGEKNSVRKAQAFAKYCDALLLDTSTRKLGGSGLAHDWSISKEIVKKVKKPVILAGGLTPENVKKAVKAVKPYAVDVSSGVESSPCKKDPEKVRKFIEGAKSLGAL